MVGFVELKKQIAKMRQNPKHVRYSDIEHLLLSVGYTHEKRGTSHNVFKLSRKGQKTLILVVPYKRPHVSAIYVKQMLKQLYAERLIK